MYPTTFEMGSLSPPEIDGKRNLDLEVSFVVLPSVFCWAPQGVKVKPPSVSNDKFAYQEYQDPLATMPEICNPKTMSNGRGLTAAGVTHEIYDNI